MANPNIVNVQLIRGKTSVRNYVKMASRFLLRNNSSSNEILKVNSIIATSRSLRHENVSISYVSSLGTFNIITDINVPPMSSVNLMQKETSIYLEENTSLNVFSRSSNDNISIICSYEQIASTIVSDRSDNYGGDELEPLPPQGQQIYTTPGTYSWVAPTGVSSVCVVCIGAGGAGDDGNAGDGGGGGGAGGGLVYANFVPVTPGQSYSVIVGAGGNNGNGKNARASDGGNTSFTVGTFVMTAIGGQGGAPYNNNPGATGRSYTVVNTPGGVTVNGGTGGNGGGGFNGGGGGGGTGGYTGAGGAGSLSNTGATAASGVGFGSGGGGGPVVGGSGNSGGSNGGNGQNDVTGGGGGGATLFSASNPPTNGGNGNGLASAGSKGGDGGWPGGGGGGSWDNNTGVVSIGGHGAVKILWGQNRSFPFTANDV